MIAGDEFYPDDVTSGAIEDDDVQECDFGVEADWDEGHWVVVRCGKPATDGVRCGEHAGAEQ